MFMVIYKLVVCNNDKGEHFLVFLVERIAQYRIVAFLIVHSSDPYKWSSSVICLILYGILLW
jgi:hypothetical protein